MNAPQKVRRMWERDSNNPSVCSTVAVKDTAKPLFKKKQYKKTLKLLPKKKKEKGGGANKKPTHSPDKGTLLQLLSLS